MSYGGGYGHEVADWFELGALAFCAALTLEDDSRCGPGPGAGSGPGPHSRVLSARLARQFAALVVQPPAADECKTIFARRLQTWLEAFPSSEMPNPVAVQQVCPARPAVPLQYPLHLQYRKVLILVYL